MRAIKINDFYLDQIKSALAYPVAPRIHLTDDEIKIYAVWEAMYEYYLKFPIPKYEQHEQPATPVTYPYPNEDTIGLIDVRTVDKDGDTGSNGSDFWKTYNYNQQFGGRSSRSRSRNGGSRSRNSYSPNGLRHMVFQQEMLIDATSNNLSTFKQIIDPYERTLTVYSSINAKIDITWAQTSNDFDRIKPTQLLKVINLAKANLRLHLASLGGMLVDSAAEKQINVDFLVQEAEKVKEKIKEEWAMSPDAVAIRML